MEVEAPVVDLVPGVPPRAVTFDFWNTLVVADTAQARGARRRALAAVLAAHGIVVAEGVIDRALGASAQRFDDAWKLNRQFVAEDGAAVVVEELGLAAQHDLVAGLVVAYARAAADLPHALAPGVATVLEALHGEGIALGIVCDVGLTPSDVLRGYLADHGVLGWFDHWSFSDEVGRYKPDPVIFRHAVAGLGVDDPGQVVHVGDLIRTDVVGARAMGMGAVRYAGIHDDAPSSPDGGPEPTGGSVDAHVVVWDHRDLPRALGLR